MDSVCDVGVGQRVGATRLAHGACAHTRTRTQTHTHAHTQGGAPAAPHGAKMAAAPGLARRAAAALLPAASARRPRRRAARAMAAATHGAWPSPITSEVVTAGAAGLGGATAGADGETYWLEARPWEGGRNVLVARAADGSTREVTPADVNVRTRVHEYGGGAFAVLRERGEVVFCDFSSQRLFVQSLAAASDSAPRPLTPALEGPLLRFADFCLDAARNRLLCVMEDHRLVGAEGGAKEPTNVIAAVSLDEACAEPTVLASGFDFFSSPRLSPDGARAAYIRWSHPSMPWDKTSLVVADVGANGSFENERVIAGVGAADAGDEAPQQPQWSHDGSELYFVSDRVSGWWNLWAWDAKGGEQGSLRSVCPMEGAEFGSPPWVFGQNSYALLPDGNIICTYSRKDVVGRQMAEVNPASGELRAVESPYAMVSGVSVGADGELAVIGGSPLGPAEVAVRSPAGEWASLKKASETVIDPGYLSEPRVIEYPTAGGRTSFMYFYPPTNKDASAPAGELPPVLVKSHGGPTSATSAAYNLRVQYFTSRGFAVADVNYGGSTGYGREYRERLNGNWGVVDVEDCAGAATYLIDEGMVDPKRTCIDGGSAGGYTTLACLAFTDVFRAGCSLYGVASLEALAGDTHKCVGARAPAHAPRARARARRVL